MLTVDDIELVGAVALDRFAEHAEAGIVDEVFDLDAGGGQGVGNLVACIGCVRSQGMTIGAARPAAVISPASAVRRSTRRATSATR